MRHLYRNTLLILAVILLSIWAIMPPEKRLSRAKDLAGGVSLIYQVELKPNDPGDTVDQVIALLKNRVDPNGVLDISMVKQGTNRIEITMPLPSPAVQRLKAEYDAAVEALGQGALTPDQAAAVMALPADQRSARLTDLAAGDSERAALLSNAASLFDAASKARAAFSTKRPELTAALKAAREALAAAQASGTAQPAEIENLSTAADAAENALAEAAAQVAQADRAYAEARDRALATAIVPQTVRAAFELSDQPIQLREKDEQGKFKSLPSPRAQAIAALKRDHPAAAARIEAVEAKFAVYAKERKSLDDPQDLIRLLKGAGVLEFRIAVQPADLSVDRLTELRAALAKGGPRSVKASDVGWYKLGDLKGWYQKSAEATALMTAPVEFLTARFNLVGGQYRGEPYILLWNIPGARLTQAEGQWRVAAARATVDEIGRPAIGFAMDALGTGKMRTLTGGNLQKPMAILLDDLVMGPPPNINSTIGRDGIIQGSFTIDEVNRVVRILAAGSLAAKLSPEPIGQQTVGPELGADNLQRGLMAGVVSFAFVAGFMIVYYWSGGFIAVLALAVNGLLILALMSVNRAAFSLPGIAGVILTFGMAVDANVLVFERMREEMLRGHDLRTVIRLGYSKALSAIIDGNITNLIVCVVLGFTGTQEIRGFAITMSIGVLTTLFAQLYVTRVLYYWLVEKFGWKRINMLPLAVPAIQRAITPNIDWMKYRYVFYTLSTVLTVLAVVAIGSRGASILDNEFRGGTKITVQFKDDASGQAMTLTRADVQKRVSEIQAFGGGERQTELRQAEVLAINPRADGVTSSTFQIKTTLRDSAGVAEAVSRAFADVLDVRNPLEFTESDNDNPAAAPVYPILADSLREVINRPTNYVVPERFIGGAAIVLENLRPAPVRLADIELRLNALKTDPAFASIASRPREWVILDGDAGNVRTAVLLVADETIKYGDDRQRWESELRNLEWRFVTASLGRAQTLAGVESFSAAIAQTFVAQAAVAILLSTLMIVIYVWVRFNSFRYSAAAILSTLHDCFIAVGAIAVADMLYDAAPDFSAAIGLLPFKIDLNVIAAVLTLLGYALNDTIVILDRIRENRGKLPYASRETINRSINQTFSRTIMTGGSVIAATIVIYFMAGEAIRPFAFCFLVGVLTGTYSSVAIAAPLAWSKRLDATDQGKPAPTV